MHFLDNNVLYRCIFHPIIIDVGILTYSFNSPLLPNKLSEHHICKICAQMKASVKNTKTEHEQEHP